MFDFGLHPEVSTACVYHHIDTDGQCSAAIVYHDYPDAHFIGMNYEPITKEEFLTAFPNLRELFVVDYSFMPEIFKAISDKDVEIIWCDHHISAIQRYHDFVKEYGIIENLNANLSLDNKKSGCMMTWERLHSRKTDLWDIPMVVQLISTFDTWQTDSPYWKDAFAINAALNHHNAKYNTYHYKKLMFNDDFMSKISLMKKLFDEGYLICNAEKKSNYNIASYIGGTIRWKGFSFFAINTKGYSTLARDVATPDHDAIMVFYYVPRDIKWKISLYSNRVARNKDVKLSHIAKEFGGGGHDGACSFLCENLPFDIHKIIA